MVETSGKLAVWSVNPQAVDRLHGVELDVQDLKIMLYGKYVASVVLISLDYVVSFTTIFLVVDYG